LDLTQQIQIFGDSILKEVMLDKNNEHYYIPKESSSIKIEKLLPVHIQNNSRFGCTIGRGFEQLGRAINKGLNCDIVLLGYGGNDCDYNWAEVAKEPKAQHLPNTPLDIFEKTYRKMIKELQEKSIRPLLMSLPPIDAERYFDWITRDGLNRESILEWLGDKQMMYRFQELYSNTVVKIAHETGCLLVDVRSRFLDKRNYKELLCEDGIHPTEKGYDIIKQAFVNFACENL